MLLASAEAQAPRVERESEPVTSTATRTVTDGTPFIAPDPTSEERS
jgi:hypothetical protein